MSEPLLTRTSLVAASRQMAARDPDFGRILSLHGPPPLWARRPGFRTLAQIILEQQVSLAAGRAALKRLEGLAGRLTPARVRTLGPGRIRSAGVTRQKTRYLVALADAVDRGTLRVGALSRLGDEAVRKRLTAIVGIGPWTADVYLLMALRRADVWPSGDLALAKATQALKGLPNLPTSDALDQLSTAWVPLRAVAARMLWHYYLSGGADNRSQAR